MKKEIDKSRDELLREIQKLKEEQQTLREDQRRYSTLVQNLNGAVYRCKNDRNYTMEALTGEIKQLTGYLPEDFIANKHLSWNDLIAEEDRDRIRKVIQKSLKNRERFTLDYMITDASGIQKWVWEQGCGIFDSKGNVEALEGFITDITKWKHSEIAKEENEQKFRSLYENAPVAYFSVSSDGKITRCNKKAYSLLGYPDGTLPGKDFDEFLTGSSGEKPAAGSIFSRLDNWVELPVNEVQLLRADGNTVWVRMTINSERNAQGDVEKRRILVLNIESQKKAEEELQVTLKRLSLAAKSAGIGIWVLDLETGNLTWDNKMYEIYGVSPDERDGASPSWKEFIHPDDAVKTLAIYNQALKEKNAFHTDYRIVRPDQSVRYIQIHGLVHTGPDGKAVGVTGINFDETDRIRSEHHILRLNRLYTVLSNINQSIIRIRQLPEMFNEACKIAVNDGQFDLAWIGLTGSSPGEIDILAYAGSNVKTIDVVSERLKKTNHIAGPTGQAIRTEQPVIIRDIRTGLDTHSDPQTLLELGYNALACFPLVAGGQVKGVFNLYSKSSGIFDEDEIKLLTELSADISYAIEFAGQEEENLIYRNKLLEATNALGAIIEASPLAILHLSPEGKVLLWNHAAEKIFGWKHEEVVGKFLPIVQKDKQNEFKDIREHVLAGNSYTAYELIRQRKDGSKIFVSLSTSAIYDKNGNISGIIEVLEDIGSRKMAERKLMDSEARYRYLFQNNPHPMIVYDRDSLDILEVNDAAVIKYGYSREEFRKIKVSDIRPEEEREKFLTLMSSEREPIRHSGTWKHNLKNGSTIDVDITSHTLEYEGHKAVLVLAQDVTERKKWEEDLIRAKEEAEQSNRLKDAFVANISHEIRTPLNSILGFSELIRDTLAGQVDEELDRYFENITKSSHRLMRTVDMILNFSRLQVGAFNIHPIVLKLPELVEQLVDENKLSALNKSLELSFENKVGDVRLKLDEYCTMQAIANLIDNALKYTNEGSIHLILYTNEEGFLNLDVADTGIGMSEEFFSQLFRPYSQEDIGYTRSYEGIGLGLSMVKQYLELNGASVSFRSVQNHGSVFTIHFNQRPSTEETVKAQKENKQEPDHVNPLVTVAKNYVLVVEDDPFSQDYLETILADNYHVLIAERADEALKMLLRQHVSVILMDISLKGEMDGLKLTRKLKDNPDYHSIPVIVLTAHAFSEDRKRSMDAGCDAYFSKPFNPRELLNKMDELQAGNVLSV